MSSASALKQRLTVLYPILVAFITMLGFLTLSRLGLCLWQADRVIDFSSLMQIMFGGLRIDISSICYLLILPSLITTLISGDHIIGRTWNKIFAVWIFLGLFMIIFMEAATPPFIIEYDVRPQRLFVEYLKYPQEVGSMLITGYKLELAFGFVVSLLTTIYGWRFARSITSNLSYPRWFFRPILALLVVAIGFLGARGTLQHRPLNPALVAFSTDHLINDLSINSSYSLMFAIKGMMNEESAYDYYPKMAQDEVLQEVRDEMNLPADAFVSSEYPTLAKRQASYQGKPKNIVILLQESLGARYVGALGGLPLTPNIDKLINEYWSLDQMYATGTRSVRGIEAVTSGFGPTPARAVVKRIKSQTNFFTIASLLQKRGYHTQFVYGGESHFDNMKTYFLGNGVMDIKDLPTFDNPKFVGSWGASDGDLYDHADKQFKQLAAQGKPFFSLVFTSSNHSPFEYPKGDFELYNQPAETRENAAKYSDYAIGEFFKKAKASNYWDNTIFIIVADHDSRAGGDSLVPVGHFHIPAVIIGKDVPKKRDPRVVSQLDIPQTLLSLAGISSENPMIGMDLTKEVPKEKQRAIMQYNKNFGYMDADRNMVVFQPHKPAQGFLYHEETEKTTPKEQSAELVKRAHAIALWGSLAYLNDYYWDE